MAKVAKKKEDKELVSGIQAKDLSLEKRMELYSNDFEVFKNEKAEQYGLMFDVEIAASRQAIVARAVLIDIIKKNGNKEGQQEKE